MSLLSVAHRMGVTTLALKRLLNGEVTVSVAARLGTTTLALQRFVDGDAGSPSVAQLFASTTAAAQELRDALDENGAIGLIIGKCLL